MSTSLVKVQKEIDDMDMHIEIFTDFGMDFVVIWFFILSFIHFLKLNEK